MLERDTSRLPEAEAHYRRELPLVERLAQDFPKRPEHVLAGTHLIQPGRMLLENNRTVEAEPILRRAIEANGLIAANHPDDVQIRFDLAKCHHNQGELLLLRGEAEVSRRLLPQAPSSTRRWPRLLPTSRPTPTCWR